MDSRPDVQCVAGSPVLDLLDDLTYFGFLPEQWQSIPFWNCVGIFFCVTILKTVFVPKLASVNQTNEKKS